MLKIGERIRKARLDRGLSQGDLEAKSGLLRCYLSRVENGHTQPSLPTLVRIAAAMAMPLAEFFDDPPSPLPTTAEGLGASTSAAMDPRQLAFLDEMRQYAVHLTDHDCDQVLGLAKKMAATKG